MMTELEVKRITVARLTEERGCEIKMFPGVANQGQQTGHKKKPIFGTFVFLQFQHQYRTTRLDQPLQLSCHQKDIQASPSHLMANCG